ncbi:MAG: hypothetical protein CVV11_00815 [Gammaproteobacteria bacterium HGW-Gammaproteobacteria-15]|nr:MAG: hypothetical protein CVV11_00815 [Gammaproteobacteria bacterium HGW-Gammaproteobacteria-15]
MSPTQIIKKFDEIQTLTNKHTINCKDSDLKRASDLLTEISPKIRQYVTSASVPYGLVVHAAQVQNNDKLLLDRDLQFVANEQRLIEEHVSKHNSFFTTMTGVGYAGYFGYYSMVSGTDIADIYKTASLLFMFVSLITFAYTELKKYWNVTGALKKGHERVLAAKNSIGSYQELRRKHYIEHANFFSTGEKIRRVIVASYLLSFLILITPILCKTLISLYKFFI